MCLRRNNLQNITIGSMSMCEVKCEKETTLVHESCDEEYKNIGMEMSTEAE